MICVQPPSSVPHEPQSDEATGMTTSRSAPSSTVSGVRHTSQGISLVLCFGCTLEDLCTRVWVTGSKNLWFLYINSTVSRCNMLPGPSAKDLSRMFPTPPSAEMPCSSISSPMQVAETLTAEAIAMDTLHPHHFTASASSLVSGRDDNAGTTGSLVLLRKVELLYLPLL